MHDPPDPGARAGGQQLGAHHVGLEERRRAVDGAVHVRLGGEVHHRVVPGDQVGEQRPVADVAADEREAGVAGGQVGPVTA